MKILTVIESPLSTASPLLSQVVYIAPMKALVRERMTDWRSRLQNSLGLRLVELTGDVTPDVRAIQSADVIVTTPEKWDGISRSWQTRNYVQDVALIIIDEIHMLGEGLDVLCEGLDVDMAARRLVESVS